MTSETAETAVDVGRGQVLAGRYELLGLLGSGGMGSVYRARDRELDEVVALKMLRRDLLELPGMLDRFRREAKLARKVTHTSSTDACWAKSGRRSARSSISARRSDSIRASSRSPSRWAASSSSRATTRVPTSTSRTCRRTSSCEVSIGSCVPAP